MKGFFVPLFFLFVFVSGLFLPTSLGAFSRPDVLQPPHASVGPLNIAVLLVKPKGFTGELPLPSDVYNDVFQGEIQSFLREMSYDRAWLEGDVYGWYEVDSVTDLFQGASSNNRDPKIDRMVADRFALLFDALGSTDPSLNLRSYSLFAILFPSGSSGSTYGLPGPFLFSTSEFGDLRMGGFSLHSKAEKLAQDRSFSHELLHALGVAHANALECGSVSIGDQCRILEYANYVDLMGWAYYLQHTNAAFKHVLGWLRPYEVVTVTQSGTYVILRALESSLPLVLRIQVPGSSNEWYYMEYREPIGHDSYLGKEFAPSGNPNVLFKNAGGVYINKLFTWDNFPVPDTVLIDTQPNDEYRTGCGEADPRLCSDLKNVALMPGSSFSDGKIMIKNVGRAGEGVQVRVDFLNAERCVHDINGDGISDIADLGRIGQRFGESGAYPGWIPEDVNADGIINIIDLALVAREFGTRCPGAMAPGARMVGEAELPEGSRMSSGLFATLLDIVWVLGR